MPTCTLTLSTSIGGVAFRGTMSRTEEGQIGQVVSLPAAKAGSLTTRTGDTEGSLTLSANHGVQTGDTINVYWSGGCRYGVTVGTVNVNVVPISEGAGDNLPAQDTALTAAKVVVVETVVDGDDVVLLAATCDQRAYVDIQESGGEQIAGVELPANEPWAWAEGGPLGANPLAGKTVGQIVAANSSASAAATLRVGLLYSSVE